MYEEKYINCTIKCWFKQYSWLMHKMSYVNSEYVQREKKLYSEKRCDSYTAVTSCVTEMCPPVTFICDSFI